MIQFSILGICLGVLLLAVPLLIMYKFKINFARKTLIVIAKMAVFACLTGLLMQYVIYLNNVFVNILFALMMVVAASFSTIIKSRQKARQLLIPVCAGIFWSAIVVSLFFVFLVMGVKTPFDARYFIPVTGLLLGNIIETNYKALSTYYMGLKYHGQLYYYLTGNGATRNEATTYLMRRALEKTMIGNIANMSALAGMSTIIIWSAFIAGASVFDAVTFQILIVIAMFCVSTLSVVCTLWFTRRYSHDEYDRLRDVSKGVDVNHLV